MMTDQSAPQIHLWAFLQGIGHYPSGWRHPQATPAEVFTMDYYRRVGRLAERGRFDAIVFGDQLHSRGAGGRTSERLAMPTLDPVTLLVAMAAVTEHVGLVATISTTYNSPQMLAERLATMDRITGGRAGWNIVTSAYATTAGNFGEEQMPEKSARYANAVSTVAEATRLWQQAEVPIPQGRPVFIQAGQSGDGRDFAARTAEAIFCPAATIDDGIAFRTDLRQRIAAVGRNPDAVRIMPGLSFILAPTEEEALAKDAALLELADLDLCIEYLAESLTVDLSGQDPSAPIPLEHILENTLAPREDIAKVLAGPASKGISLGDFATAYVRTPRGHNVFRGSPEQMADMMIRWVDAGACDGFTMQPAWMPGELELFVDQVVPILQEKGRLRRNYPGKTLRDTLGLGPLEADLAA
ncbi:LLM class flavin-dependent oxidoreductase [Rhizorhabdus phycosphaerae]|uniref:LLM class flavin-dependent oxidoreductase n=1 Tax=Rhizorhabdus phycosphaerae TaxID=2711156 RepID=UPI001D02B367|nr:LLM class flavin-dependent oxidoreductase [Rhizorhabdus phycosphaerae]